MACVYCRIEISETVCQVCKVIESQSTRFCKQCGAPLDDPNWLGRFCHICNVMYETVRASRWLSQAQLNWIHENFALARRKRALLGRPSDGQGPTAV